MTRVQLWLSVVLVAISLPGHAAPDDDLFKAAEEGDDAKLEKILAGGGNVGARDAQGRTPLMMAAGKGRASTVDILLQKGSDVNAFNANGFTALHTASLTGNTEIVRLLLQRGANANQESSRGATPIFGAAASGDIEVARALLEQRGEINKRAEGQTPLIRAAMNGRSEMVEFLLKNGADAKATTLDGRTALSAVGSRCLSAEAANALMQSASFPKTELSRALHHAVVGPQDTKTCSAFVRYLLETGADVNHQNNVGNTALILASMWGQTEAVRILLSKGADVTIKNKAGETAADVAKNREIRALITESRAK